LASWTGTRWVVADDTDLLRSSVRDYLNRLHASLPPPPKGRDYRAKLKSAPFCRDVTTEALIKLTPIRQEAFDCDEYLLGMNNGTVFEVTPTGTLTTLYNFCKQDGCTDGLNPAAGLVQAADGNFYGTTSSGGTYGYGTVFRLDVVRSCATCRP
jgi:uncharacterized repeat protein (TIGR03803 family)